MGAEDELGSLLAELPQRESAGRTAADRFDYQKNWALCRILELHAKDGDYVLFLEFHEDIAILDSATQPSVSTFVQVKTAKSGSWTIRKLTKRSKATGAQPGSSILGKLCEKDSKLKNSKREFRFVTNASIDLGQPATGEPGELDVKLIPAATVQELQDSLKDELGVDVNDLVVDRLRFETSDLALENHEDATQGRLATFVDTIATGCAVSIAPFYRTLLGEMRRRTVAYTGGTFAQACGRKAVSRADLDSWLQKAIRSTPADRTWTLVLTKLDASDSEIGRLNRAFSTYYVWSLQTGKPGIQTLRARLHHEMASLRAAGASLLESSASAVATAKEEELRAVGLDSNTAQVMVLMGLYEEQEREIPNADSEPTDPRA